MLGGGVSASGRGVPAPIERALDALRAASELAREAAAGGRRPSAAPRRRCRRHGVRVVLARSAARPGRPREVGCQLRRQASAGCRASDRDGGGDRDEQRPTDREPAGPPPGRRSTRRSEQPRDVSQLLTAGLATSLAVAACRRRDGHRRTTAATTAAAADGADHGRRARETPSEPRPPRRAAARRRLAADPAEAVIPNVEANAEITLLDVLPVADVRPVHQGHDRPLRGDLSGRQGQLGRPPGHVQGRPEQRLRGRQRAGRDQPVGQRGLGQRLRHARACSCRSTTRSRQAVKDVYFPGLWKDSSSTA